MANLSNINNKFLVTTGGNVLIGQTSAVGSSIFQVTGDSTFTGNILIGNTVVNPASGFADQTGIGLKYSTTVPEIQVSSDNAAMQLGRTTTGGDGQILALRKAGTVIHAFSTNAVSIGTASTFAGTVLIDGLSNYTGLTVKGSGASRPAVEFRNVNQNSLGIIYGTESNALVIATGSGGIAALTLDSSQNATFAGNVALSDSGQLQLGTGNDSQIYNTGFHLFIDNSVGSTYIRNTGASSTGIIIRNDTAGDISLDNDFAGNILFNTSNVERMRIDSAGSVGIGTDSPTSILQIKEATLPRITLTKTGITDWFIGNPSQGVSNNFSIGTNSGSNTEILTLDSTGNVGIGTDSPVTKLDVYNSSTSSVVVAKFGAQLYGSANNTYIEIGTQYADGGSRIGSNNTSGNASSLMFETMTTTSGVYAERMRIDSSGDVGIGTSPGSNRLHVKGNVVGGSITTRFEPLSNNAQSTFFLSSTGSGDGGYYYDSNSNLSGMFSYGDYTFNVGTANISGTIGDPRMVIQQGGNVGIGTTSPLAKTHIIGLNQPTGGTRTTYGNLFVSSTDVYGANIGGSIGLGGSGNGGAGTNLYTFSKIKGGKETAAAGNDAGYMAFETGNGANSLVERMRITSAGQVLIGADQNQTQSKLTVRQNGSSIEFGHTNQTGQYYGTLGAMSSSGDPFIAFSSDNSSANSFTTKGTPGNVIYGSSGNLVFAQLTSANTANQNLNERMRIDSAGNVGIGTTSPAYPLEVENPGTAYLFSETTGAGGSSGFRWKTPDSEFSWYSSGGLNDMNLYDYTASSVRFTIDSGGNVGIGTTSPDAKLEVVGNVIITGAYTDQNGVRTFREGGTMVNGSAYNVDITVDDDTGTGTVHHITAMMTHYSTSYGCVLDCYAYTRGTGVNAQTDLLNQSNAAAGGWTVSKSGATTLRLTKSAGTYSGGGNYQVVVVTSTP